MKRLFKYLIAALTTIGIYGAIQLGFSNDQIDNVGVRYKRELTYYGTDSFLSYFANNGHREISEVNREPFFTQTTWDTANENSSLDPKFDS